MFIFFQAHIFNLLKSKLTSYRDFHTLLYICAAEFDFLSTTTLYQLSSTLLLPSVYMSLGLIALYAMGALENVPVPKRQVVISKKREPRKEKELKKEVVSDSRKVDPAVLYNVLQLAAFVIMTFLFMRLKLFMSPHLCLTAALLASRKVTSIDWSWNSNISNNLKDKKNAKGFDERCNYAFILVRVFHQKSIGSSGIDHCLD